MKKKDNEIQQIKDVFMNLDSDHKIEARQRISTKFNVSTESVNNRWIYEGKIPDAKVKGVLAIVKTVAGKQIRKFQKLIA